MAETDWKAKCISMGACPTCIDGPTEPYGCSDCLNTGWQFGDPYQQIERAAEVNAVLVDAVNAGIKLKTYFEKSINAGPLTKDPSREAALLRAFYEKIDKARIVIDPSGLGDPLYTKRIKSITPEQTV